MMNDTYIYSKVIQMADGSVDLNKKKDFKVKTLVKILKTRLTVKQNKSFYR